MTIPKRIKFMGYTFQVTSETERAEEEECYGIINYKTQTIRLYNPVSNERKAETLIHELIHLVTDFLKINLEEDDVSRLGKGLYAALKENGMLCE